MIAASMMLSVGQKLHMSSFSKLLYIHTFTLTPRYRVPDRVLSDHYQRKIENSGLTDAPGTLTQLINNHFISTFATPDSHAGISHPEQHRFCR